MCLSGDPGLNRLIKSDRKSGNEAASVDPIHPEGPHACLGELERALSTHKSVQLAHREAVCMC